MTEAKQAKFEDSNIAALGSYEDIQARLNAAKTESEWAGAGQAVGLEVWRVFDFKVHKVAAEERGQFFTGDSYIVLNTYKSGTDKMGYDVHFWLGKESSQDERGTAAYKTVELDDLLGTLPIQHRETQGHESPLFLSYFKPSMQILKGGMPSAFKHVGPKEYKPRLLHVKQVGKAIKVVEVPFTYQSLNSNDTFVLDAGLTIYVWNGNKCSGQERYKGNLVAEGLQADRGDKPTIIHTDQADDNADFWRVLGSKGPVSDSDTEPVAVRQNALRVFRLSDAHGSLKMDEVYNGKGPLSRSLLKTEDVFIVDTPETIFVWVGNGASIGERRNSMRFAMVCLTHVVYIFLAKSNRCTLGLHSKKCG